MLFFYEFIFFFTIITVLLFNVVLIFVMICTNIFYSSKISRLAKYLLWSNAYVSTIKNKKSSFEIDLGLILCVFITIYFIIFIYLFKVK